MFQAEVFLRRCENYLRLATDDYTTAEELRCYSNILQAERCELMARMFTLGHLLTRVVIAVEMAAKAAERASFNHGCKHTVIAWTSRKAHNEVQGQCEACGTTMTLHQDGIEWILKYKQSLAKKDKQ